MTTDDTPTPPPLQLLLNIAEADAACAGVVESVSKDALLSANLRMACSKGQDSFEALILFRKIRKEDTASAPAAADLLAPLEGQKLSQAPYASDERLALMTVLGNPATRDTGEHLIRPLIERGLKFKGNPHQIIVRTAQEFSDFPAYKLKDAAKRLCEGKHSYFPDYEEIYAAIGRYRARQEKGAAA